ncbi:MAG: DUF975 family protein [Opitutaceae bacterium]
MEWFYEKNGAQSGPVSEEELKGLIASGELQKENLVWRQGMSDWAPYSTLFELTGSMTGCPTCGVEVSSDQLIPAGDRQVCPNCRDSYAQGLKEGVTSTASLSGGRGTGGMTPNPDLRAMGKDALSGQWGMAVVVTLVFMLMQQVVAFIPFIGALIQWVIVGPLTIGFSRAFLNIHRGQPADVGALFSAFDQFWRGFGIYFMTNLIVGLSAMAAAIPGGILVIVTMSSGGAYEENPLFIIGMIAAAIPAMIVGYYMFLRYALVYFIASDHPELGVFEVLESSKQMMDGHKKKLFWLYFSYIPWFILGFLALLVGLLWSMTYLYAGLAAFYDDLGEEA